jgi:hypothetical protein
MASESPFSPDERDRESPNIPPTDQATDRTADRATDRVAERAAQPPGELALWKRALLKGLKLVAAALAWAIAELEAEDVPQRGPQPAAAVPPSRSGGSGESANSDGLGAIAALPVRVARWTLALVRSVMPDSMRRLSDRNLTLTLGGISVFLVWVAVGLLGPELRALTPEPPPTVAIAPPPPPPAVATPEPPPPPLFPELDLPVAEPTPDPPAAPEPVDTPPPVAKTPPRLDLTPEQSAIAAIQDQLTAIARRYGESDIVTAIQADFRYSRLKIQVDAGGWFALANPDQDQLAQDLLDRANNLDFSKLEILTQDDTLLARSPAVGDRAVIFRRQPLPS